MKDVVKVQQNKTNTFVCLPKDIRGALELIKGDKVLLTVEGNKIILEKC